jgi:putative membrane protein
VVGNNHGHQTAAGIGVALFLSFALAFAVSVWRQLNGFWDFTLDDSADGLRVTHGLLSTTRQTVPPGRIQAVRIHQPLSWRPFGWARLRMNVAGYGRSDSSSRTMLLPVADRRYAEQFTGWLLGGQDLDAISLSGPPRRARLRAPLWWRYEKAGWNDRLFVSHHGALSRTIDVVPHERTQSLRLTAGPVERALGLASVHLDSTIGPVTIRAAYRDAGEARGILDGEIERGRSARELARSHPLHSASLQPLGSEG